MGKVEAHHTTSNACADELIVGDNPGEDHIKNWLEGLYSFVPDLQHPKTEGRPVYKSTKNHFRLFYDRQIYDTSSTGVTRSRGWDGTNPHRLGKWCIGVSHELKHGYCALKSEFTESLCPTIENMVWFQWDRDAEVHQNIGTIILRQTDVVAVAEQMCLIHCDPAASCRAALPPGSYGYENERDHGEAYCAKFCVKPDGEDTCAPKFWQLPQMCGVDETALADREHTENILNKFCTRNCRANDHTQTDEVCEMRDIPNAPTELAGVPMWKGRPTYRLGISDYESAHEHGNALCASMCNPQTAGNEVKQNSAKCQRASEAVTGAMCNLGALSEVDETTGDVTHGFTLAWRQRNGWTSDR